MSEEEPTDLTVDTVNFQTLFTWMIKQAQEHAPENYSISVKASRGQVSGEITFTAPVRYSRRPQPKPKPLNLLGAQGVVAEYPDLLSPTEETTDFWYIGTKKNLGDSYLEINKKLRDNCFAYERWNKDAPHTGGWRGKKCHDTNAISAHLSS